MENTKEKVKKAKREKTLISSKKLSKGEKALLQLRGILKELHERHPIPLPD